jgi:hypothetical protein
MPDGSGRMDREVFLCRHRRFRLPTRPCYSSGAATSFWALSPKQYRLRRAWFSPLFSSAAKTPRRLSATMDNAKDTGLGFRGEGGGVVAVWLTRRLEAHARLRKNTELAIFSLPILPMPEWTARCVPVPSGTMCWTIKTLLFFSLKKLISWLFLFGFRSLYWHRVLSWFFDFYGLIEKIPVHCNGWINAISILLFLYGLAIVKFIMGIRLDIFFNNHELQLWVRFSTQISYSSFFKKDFLYNSFRISKSKWI